MAKTGGYSVESAPVLPGSLLVANELKTSGCGQEDYKHDNSSSVRLRAVVQRSSSLKEAAILKRESAMQCMQTGDFMQAWELYNEIGDRVEAQDALEQAYRSSKRDKWLKPAIEIPSTDQTDEIRQQGDDQSLSKSDSRKAAESRRPFSAMSTRASLSDSMKSSESRRPCSAGSQASPWSFVVGGLDLAKALRRGLGVNPRKAQKVKELFSQWNCDGSGAMSLQEFGNGVKSVQPFVDEKDIDAAFLAADTDCMGYLLEQDFIKWLLEA